MDEMSIAGLITASIGLIAAITAYVRQKTKEDETSDTKKAAPPAAGGVSITGSGQTRIGGDVVGRDKKQ